MITILGTFILLIVISFSLSLHLSFSLSHSFFLPFISLTPLGVLPIYDLLGFVRFVSVLRGIVSDRFGSIAVCGSEHCLFFLPLRGSAVLVGAGTSNLRRGQRGIGWGGAISTSTPPTSH